MYVAVYVPLYEQKYTLDCPNPKCENNYGCAETFWLLKDLRTSSNELGMFMCHQCGDKYLVNGGSLTGHPLYDYKEQYGWKKENQSWYIKWCKFEWDYNAEASERLFKKMSLNATAKAEKAQAEKEATAQQEVQAFAGITRMSAQKRPARKRKQNRTKSTHSQQAAQERPARKRPKKTLESALDKLTMLNDNIVTLTNEMSKCNENMLQLNANFATHTNEFKIVPDNDPDAPGTSGTFLYHLLHYWRTQVQVNLGHLEPDVATERQRQISDAVTRIMHR